MRILTVKIDEYLYEELQLCSANQRRSMSAIVREALTRYLEAEEADQE